MLDKIQALVKAPKGQFNSFGKYKYRSCEDIVEAVKPIINPLGYYLILSDEVVEVGGRVYVKATASLCNGEIEYISTAYAREEEVKKGMDGSQITGSSSSYARKYALNGLFAIDDTQDSDSTNTHGKDCPTAEEKVLLGKLVYKTNMDTKEREHAFELIDSCDNYELYTKIQHRLEERQLPFDEIPNPTKSDINKHLKKSVK